MANQTLAANSNLDSAGILGLNNGEDITLAGFSLTWNSDNRWSQQAAVVGNFNYSTTLGGSVIVDGREVWWIPYTGGTGTVPALGTAGTQNSTGGTSGATGEFLGVWASIPGAPVSAAASVPATGFIKFRSKVGTFTNGETITLSNGATLTVNSATGGQRGWLHIVGEAGNNVSVPRLGSLDVIGDWYELGTTNGADDQTFAIPVLDTIPAIWVETAAGSGVYEKWLNAGTRWGTATQYVSTDARGKFFGQWKEVAANATLNNATVTMADTTGFTVGMPVQNTDTTTVANLQDGSVITAINPGVSVTLSKTALATIAINFRSPLTTITIARRASNACGFKPPTGCKVRVPNVFLSQADSGSWSGNQLHVSNGSRYELQGTNAGAFTLSKCSCNWYLNVYGAYSFSMTDCAHGAPQLVAMANFATPFTFTGNASGVEGLLGNNIINIANIPYGGTVSNNRACRAFNNAQSLTVVNANDSALLTFSGNSWETFGNFGLTTRQSTDVRSLSFSRVFNFSISNETLISGSIYLAPASFGTVTNTIYADALIGTTTTTSGIEPIRFVGGCDTVTVSGFSYFGGIADVNPYSYLVAIGTSSTRIKVRNIGTASSPLSAGTVNICAGALTLGSSLNCEFNRIYLSGARTSVITGSNTGSGVVADNIWGNPATGVSMVNLNTTFRGLRATSASTGSASVYGAHWMDVYTSTTAGRLVIYCNEPTSATASQAVITAGTPRYTSAGSVSMPTIGDQIVWEMPHFMLGHTSFLAGSPTITGTLTGNITLEFQWDTGAGYNGSWLALTSGNLSGIGSWSASTGVKIKVRATTTVADPTNALVLIRIDTVTDAVSQQVEYPYQYTAAITASPIVAGSRVQIYNETTATELYNATAAGTSITLEYYDGIEASDGDVIRLRVAKISGVTAYLPFETKSICSSSGVAFLVAQEADAVYNTYGIDGAAVTNFTADLIDTQVDVITTANFTGEQYYAWYCYYITTSAGIANFFGGVTAVDAGNILNDVTKVDIMWDNTTAQNVHQTDSIRISRSDGLYPVYDPTTGGGGIDLNWKVQVYVSDANVPTAADVATAVWDMVSQSARTYGAEHRDMYAVMVGATAGRGSPAEVFKDPTGAGRVVSNNDGTNRTSVVVSGS